MKNSILGTSYISCIILILLIILEVVLINSYSTYVRGAKVVLSYFFHLPLFIINLILSIKVFVFYYKNQFTKPLKALYFVIPSFIFLLSLCVKFNSWID